MEARAKHGIKGYIKVKKIVFLFELTVMVLLMISCQKAVYSHWEENSDLSEIKLDESEEGKSENAEVISGCEEISTNEEADGDYITGPAMVRILGRLYLIGYDEAEEPREDAFFGTITGCIQGNWHFPTQDNEGTCEILVGSDYAIEEDLVKLFIEDAWRICYLPHPKATEASILEDWEVDEIPSCVQIDGVTYYTLWNQVTLSDEEPPSGIITSVAPFPFRYPLKDEQTNDSFFLNQPYIVTEDKVYVRDSNHVWRLFESD